MVSPEESAFRADLQALLDKHGASMEAEGEGGDFTGQISVFIGGDEFRQQAYFGLGFYLAPTGGK